MRSMTGFAASDGVITGWRWRWEARSVNGRGLDLRFRLAEGCEALEPALRSVAGKGLSRGNVSLILKLDSDAAETGVSVDDAALSAVVDAALKVEAAAFEAGLTLAPSTAAQLLGARGVLSSGDGGLGEAEAKVHADISKGFAALIDGLRDARTAEGAHLAATLARIIDQIEALTTAAAAAHAAQGDAAASRLKDRVAALMEAEAGADPDRLAQELALIAVKADVAEELERLAAHVAAARDLIAADGPVGRKLDFLTQEFNREANTLCSKSASADLTRIGLDMKVLIDQMREQAQNVE